MTDIEPTDEAPNDLPDLVEKDEARTVECTGTDEAGNPTVTPIDVLYQVVHPLGHFERFTFANETPVQALEIGYRIEPPPGPPHDRMGVDGMAPPHDVWVDDPPPEGKGRRIVVRAHVETAPPCPVMLDYMSGLPVDEEWIIRSALIRVDGDDPDNLLVSGVLRMEKDDGDFLEEDIPPRPACRPD